MSSQTTAPAVPAEHRILLKEGKFPKALRLGVRAVGWDSA